MKIDSNVQKIFEIDSNKKIDAVNFNGYLMDF